MQEKAEKKTVKKTSSENTKKNTKPTTKKTTVAKTSATKSTGAKKTSTTKSSNLKTTKSINTSTNKSSTVKTTKTKINKVNEQVDKPVAVKIEESKPVLEKKQEDFNIFSFKWIALLLLLFAIIFSLTFVLTYGFFTYSRTGTETNKVTTASFNILIDDDGDLGINQTNSFPVYDEVGRGYDPYSFSLKNLGSIEANYVLRLVPDEEAIREDGCGSKILADESIKVQLIKDGTVVKESLLSDLDNYELDSGFIGLEESVNKMYSYELRLWIDSNAGAEVMGKHYHGRIEVELSDPANS